MLVVRKTSSITSWIHFDGPVAGNLGTVTLTALVVERLT